MKIGIIDYGIGGVSLYKRLREVSRVDIVYLSDTGYVPYGKVPREELQQRVADVIDYLFEWGTELVVIACNAASTVAPVDNRVIHMIDFGLQSVKESRVQTLGIVGGYRTIESELYKQPFAQEMRFIRQEVAQTLSIRMEAGDLDSPELDEDVRRIFQPLADCEGILLGCTHYPALKKRIQPVVPNSLLIDPMDLLVNSLLAQFPNPDGDSSTHWLTTGSAEKMKVAAQKAFDVQLDTIQTITL